MALLFPVQGGSKRWKIMIHLLLYQFRFHKFTKFCLKDWCNYQPNLVNIVLQQGRAPLQMSTVEERG